MFSGKKIFSRFEDQVLLVIFPLYRHNECENVNSVVKEIDLYHGLSCIGDNTIDMDTIAEMIDILSDYDHFNVKKYAKFSDDIFMVVRTIIVDFVSNLRIGSVYQLL